jgi:hypothetical protein
MDDPEPSLHRLAARNVVVGDTEFLSLPLPPPWRLTRAVVTPEVRTTVRTQSRTWVVSGETRHVVFDRARNLGLDLVVRVSHGAPRMPRAAREVLDEGLATCSGHAARYRIVRRGRGLFVRGEERALLVAFACPVTDRGVLVEIAGQCGAEDLRAFLRVLPEVECH